MWTAEEEVRSQGIFSSSYLKSCCFEFLLLLSNDVWVDRNASKRDTHTEDTHKHNIDGRRRRRRRRRRWTHTLTHTLTLTPTYRKVDKQKKWSCRSCFSLGLLTSGHQLEEDRKGVAAVVVEVEVGGIGLGLGGRVY